MCKDEHCAQTLKEVFQKKGFSFQFQWQFLFKSQYKLLLKDVVRQENFVIPASKHQRLNQSTWNR